MVVEGRHRNAGQRPDVVEVDFGSQHVDERLVRLGRLYRHDEFDFALDRCAETRLAGGRVARHTESVLPGRQWRDAGVERRAAFEQFALRQLAIDPRCVVGHPLHAAAVDGQGRALLVHELANAGLAAGRVDHGLREQFGLDRQPGIQALRPAGADGVQRTVARTAPPRPLQLRVHLLQVVIGQRRVQRLRCGLVPQREAVVALAQRRAECACLGACLGAVLRAAFAIATAIATATAQILADASMRCRQHVRRRTGEFVHHAHRQRLGATDVAAAQDQVERIAQTLFAAPRGQEARQALRAAIARQEAQANLGLAEARRGFGNAPVAGQREFHAATQRDALNRGDAGLVHALDLAKREVRVVRQRARFVQRVDVFQQLPDVGAGHEAGGALAGEDHGHHIVAARQVFHHHRQLVERALVQGIHWRVGHRDRGHALRALGRGDGVVLHREVAVALEHLLVIGQLLLALPFADDALHFLHRFRVLQCRGVTDVAAFHQRTHHAPHVLAAACFRELADFDEVAGHGHRALLAAHQVREAAAVVLRQLAAGGGLHEGQRREALFAVRRTDDDDVADRAVRVQRLVAQDGTFNLFGAHAVAADVDDVVAAAVQAETAVGVAHREVALRVGPGASPALPVGAGPAFAVALPGRLHAQLPVHRVDAEIL